ncbi:MAG: PEP-CTERM sorting domain-containing protein [Alphaproteobacteria bacterium]|nr:PEP-CTERM sorting domain-containing protein [Alphaproteobacteria bacterium]
MSSTYTHNQKNIFLGKLIQATFCTIIGSLLFGTMQASATIIEIQVSSPVNSVSFPALSPYLAAGDLAKFTVRYDTETTASGNSGNTTFYNGAITYLGFDLERSGVSLYSGNASGNFGRVRVTNAPNFPVQATDSMVFDLFTDDNNYGFHGVAPRNAALTEINPPLPDYVTGDALFGNFQFEYFKINLSGVSKDVWPDTNLPDLADLTMNGGGGPFAPKLGTGLWSAGYFLPSYFPNGGSKGTFGSGAPRANSPLNATYNIRAVSGGTQNGGSNGATNIPEPNILLVMMIGLLGIANTSKRRLTNINFRLLFKSKI